jgi:hypothetical protein
MVWVGSWHKPECIVSASAAIMGIAKELENE